MKTAGGSARRVSPRTLPGHAMHIAGLFLTYMRATPKSGKKKRRNQNEQKQELRFSEPGMVVEIL
jgi:hypothetical protein